MNLVYGVGVNDAEYLVEVRAVVDGKRKAIWRCPFYRTWREMVKRCYSRKLHAKFPTYKGCSVAPEWLKLSTFSEWMRACEWDGKHLDKDILRPGNKVYGPDTCVFVTAKLNTFMNDHGAARGKWPLGVFWHGKVGRLKAQCRNPFTGKRESLGYFDCPNKAHEAWRARKHELACQYADMQTDQRIAAALRSRYLQEPRP